MRFKITHVLTVIVAVIAVALIVFAVRQKPDTELRAKDKLRLQLQWFDQAQFAGFYVAAERGFYAQEGLGVDIVPGGFDLNPISRVVSGEAQIGLATGDQILVATERGEKIRAVGTVFNKSVACFMSKKARGIKKPEQLVGLKVGVITGFDTERILLALLKRAGVPRTKVDIMQALPLDQFERDAEDVAPCYLFNEPLRMAEKNIDVELIRPDEFGVHFYSDTIFATQRFLDTNRELVKKFLRASAQGWEYAAKHPDSAVSDIFKVARNISKGTETFQRRMLNEAVKHLGDGEQKKMFFMKRERWESMMQSLLAIETLKQQVDLDAVCDFQIVPEAVK